MLVARIEDGAAGLSGALGVSNRPDLQRLAKLAKDRAFDELRVYDVDRLTRADDLRERAAVWGMALDAGAIIVDRSGREIDPADSSGMGEIDYYLRTMFAAQERRKIAERTTAGRRNAAVNGGKPQGRCEYGYTYDPKTKKWGIDAQRAKVVRSIYEQSAAGTSIERIRNNLNASQIPSPSGGLAWCAATVAFILHSSAYRGEKVFGFGAEQFRVALPPIVSDDLWHTVQTGLRRRDNAPIRDNYKHDALLRMRAVCGTCGAAMHLACSRNNKDERNHYLCATKDRGEHCGGRRRHAIWRVDEVLWAAVRSKLSDPKWLRAAIEKRNGKPSAAQSWAQQIKACKKVLSKIAKKERAVVRLLGEGIAEEAAREQLKTLDKQKATAQRSLEVAQKGQAARVADDAMLASLEAQVAALRTKLDATDFATRNSLIAALVPPEGPLATLHSDGRIEFHGILSLDAPSDASLGRKSSAAA